MNISKKLPFVEPILFFGSFLEKLKRPQFTFEISYLLKVGSISLTSVITKVTLAIASSPNESLDSSKDNLLGGIALSAG